MNLRLRFMRALADGLFYFVRGVGVGQCKFSAHFNLSICPSYLSYCPYIFLSARLSFKRGD